MYRSGLWIGLVNKTEDQLKLHLFKNVFLLQFKKFKPRLKYGLFHLKLYSIFQDLGRRSIETGFWQIWAAAQIY